MSGYLIACLAVSIAVSFVVIFFLAGGVFPEFAASGVGQTLLAVIAAAVGIVIGYAAHRRFFPGR